jgi:hypothetical protein
MVVARSWPEMQPLSNTHGLQSDKRASLLLAGLIHQRFTISFRSAANPSISIVTAAERILGK